MKNRDKELFNPFGLLPEFHLSQEFTAMVAQLDDIELPVDSTIASQIESTNPMSIQLLESDIVNDPRECTDTEKVRPINLVLTEEPLRTPPTVVENLEEDLVTQELMSSGELSTATNASLNSTQMFSPVDNWDNVQEGLETVKESQKCIESTLTHIVDSSKCQAGTFDD